MVEQFQFMGPGCGYEEMVSGGDDGGMTVVRTTVVCEDCRPLYDAVAIYVEDWKEVPLQCPLSADHRVKPWKKGGPCPQCGQRMKNGGMTILWD